jgi:sodium transport system ATP-binding protein
LDVLSGRSIINFIRRSRDENKTIILSTHYMTEAEEMCDRIGLLSKGRLAAVGTTSELFAASGAKTLTDAFFHYLGENAN